MNGELWLWRLVSDRGAEWNVVAATIEEALAAVSVAKPRRFVLVERKAFVSVVA